jgi:hypothetical protein
MRGLALVCALVGALGGCGGLQFEASGSDAADETSGDSGLEAATDASADADAEREAAGEASVDGTSDGEFEASADAQTEAGIDAPADAPARDALDDAPMVTDACLHTLFFLDGDGDGYGGTTTMLACAPPDAGAWVTKGGDCDDSNAIVNPGQTAYFPTGYVPTGKSNASFDYNCDGQETESGNAAKAACKIVNLACVGSGYIEAIPARTGVGVDPFCGSDQSVTCAIASLVCQSGAPFMSPPIACH